MVAKNSAATADPDRYDRSGSLQGLVQTFEQVTVIAWLAQEVDRTGLHGAHPHVTAAPSGSNASMTTPPKCPGASRCCDAQKPARRQTRAGFSQPFAKTASDAKAALGG